MGANASEQRLKPCPFCGASAHVREIRNCDKIMYSVSCDAEGCYGFESMACFPSLEEAMGEWNRREWPSYVIAHDEEGAGTFLYAPLRSCRMEFERHEIAERIREACGVTADA